MSTEIKIPKVVPKLKGSSNWEEWNNLLEIALMQMNRNYWPTLIGRYSTPDEPDYYDLSPESIRIFVAQDKRVAPETVAEADIHTGLKEARRRNMIIEADHQRKMEAFQQVQYDLIFILMTVLETEPRSHLTGIRDAYQAYSILKQRYERTHVSIWMLWQKINMLAFSDSMNHQEFLKKFRGLVGEMRIITNVDGWVERCLFFKAIQTAPHVEPFLTRVTTAKEEISPPELYAQFEIFEYQRVMNTKIRNQITTSPFMD